MAQIIPNKLFSFNWIANKDTEQFLVFLKLAVIMLTINAKVNEFLYVEILSISVRFYGHAVEPQNWPY